MASTPGSSQMDPTTETPIVVQSDIGGIPESDLGETALGPQTLPHNPDSTDIGR